MSDTGQQSGVHLREQLQTQDAASIEQMVEATGFFSIDEQAIARELADERLQRGDASGYFFVIAERGPQMLGYTCYGPIPGTRSAWDLYWIVVDPASQGLGIGRQLLRSTEQAILNRGGSSVYIETSSQPRYEPTRRFYLGSGYDLIGRFEDFYAPGDAKLTYHRKLGRDPGQ